MKKLFTLAAITLVAVSCNKRPLDQPAPSPVSPGADVTAPISFGATANVDVVSSKTTTALDGTVNLGVYAFKGATLPANPTAAGAAGVVWSSATNLEYRWVTTPIPAHYTEYLATPGTDKPKLFWPGSGTANGELSFASYFPFVATGTVMPAAGTQQAYVANYVLNADLTNQLTQSGKTAPYDYAFAWASLLNKARPTTMAAQDLTFNYKVAKLSLAVKGDGATIGATGLKISTGGGATDEGLKSISVYSKGSGLMADYKLDLLTGAPVAGTVNTTSEAPIKLQPTDNAGSQVAPVVLPYVEATGYLVPALNTALLPTEGIVIAVVYNDGTADQTYTAEINSTTVTNPAAAGLTEGLKAGTNYKYTLKLGKAGITFTGAVTDWTDVEYGEDIPLE